MRAQCMPRHAAVHAACGRPLTFLGSRPGEPGRRPSRPSVRVRTVPRAGAAVQPLRPRAAVLQPRLFRHGPPRSPARRRAALPEQPCGPHGACRSLTALATAAVRAGCHRRDRRDLPDHDRRRRRPRRPSALRDASGLAGRATHCSTDRERARQSGERHRCLSLTAGCTLPALCRTAVALGTPGLRASRPAALAGSCGRSHPLSSLKEPPWSSPPT